MPGRIAFVLKTFAPEMPILQTCPLTQAERYAELACHESVSKNRVQFLAVAAEGDTVPAPLPSTELSWTDDGAVGHTSRPCTSAGYDLPHCQPRLQQYKLL